MTRLDDLQNWLAQRLPELCHEHDVVGAQVGVLAGDEIVDVGAGVLNQRTGVPVTPDAVFQIGSITKLWTTSLVMQLVDEGKVEIDAPVRAYLPDFQVLDESASKSVTVRQLLTHTAGFEGDVFVSTGTGEDAVKEFVETILPGVRQNSAPGELFSYNNAGFVVLGRIVEVVRGMAYSEALRRFIAEPLRLDTVATRADEAILHAAAVGHVRSHSSKPLEPTKTWALHHSNAPAGSMLAMSARDLLGFASATLSGKVIPPESFQAVLSPQVDVPDIPRFPSQWGLGWMLFDWDGAKVVGHDGGTIGQAATFRVLPDGEDGAVAVAVLTNGGGAGPLREAVMAHVFVSLTNVRPPASASPPASPEPVVDPSRYVGSYAAGLSKYDIAVGSNGELAVRLTPVGEVARLAPSEPEEFAVVRRVGTRDGFISTRRFDGGYFAMSFIGEDNDGRAKYLHDGRANPREKTTAAS